MKINILSMQRVINYGSFLQAYALNQVIKDGNEVTFIDIKNGEKINKVEVQNTKERLLGLLKKNIKQTIGQRKQKMAFTKVYNEFLMNKLGVSSEKVYDSKSDITIIGSDEVFNCTSPSPWGFSKQLFGEGINADKVITYAASFGSTTYETIEEYNIEGSIKSALNNIKDISVRDENSYNIINKITGLCPEIVLDPTLLYDFSNEIQGIEVLEKDYIIVYAYPGRFYDKKEIESIRNFAKEHNKKLIALGYYQYWCDKNIILNPFEYVAYMKKADYIITDTFHGTIFSIKSKVKFCTFVRESNKNKLEYLLETLGLSDRIVSDSSRMNSVLEQDINYIEIEETISKKREKSLRFLNKSINN